MAVYIVECANHSYSFQLFFNIVIKLKRKSLIMIKKYTRERAEKTRDKPKPAESPNRRYPVANNHSIEFSQTSFSPLDPKQRSSTYPSEMSLSAKTRALAVN